MPPSASAAWLVTEKEHPLKVQSTEYTSPGADEVVVKNAAVALNIVDWARQALGNALFSWVTYPAIMGTDVAGEVVEVGANVRDVKTGDRVLGLTVGLGSNRPADAGFQTHTVLPKTLVARLPAQVPYDAAAVMPLALGTAATGLFDPRYLALDLPTAPRRAATGRTVLIWGGASGVGTNAIQLAAAAGYEVIAVASTKNHEYLRKLGAGALFDYKSDTVVADLVEALRGRDSVGALAIGNGVNESVFEVVSKAGGRGVVACANPVSEKVPEGLKADFILVNDLKDNGIGAAIFNRFVADGLADGTLVPSPPAEVVGRGLDAIQPGLDKVKDGVSLKKYVVSLE